MNLRDLIRNWLGLTDLLIRSTSIRIEIEGLRNELRMMHADLRASNISKIREVADAAQNLQETDPLRHALSIATNDYLVRKAKAEAKVRRTFGFEPTPEPSQLPPASDE